MDDRIWFYLWENFFHFEKESHKSRVFIQEEYQNEDKLKWKSCLWEKVKGEKILGKALSKKLPPGAIVDNKHQANKKVLEKNWIKEFWIKLSSATLLQVEMGSLNVIYFAMSVL